MVAWGGDNLLAIDKCWTGSYLERCYWSQSDGLRRFAAPISFSSPLLAPADRLAVCRRRKHQMITGTVKFFNADKGYGFIQPEDGSTDAFVHISALEAAGLRTLEREQRVTYDLENDRRGRTSAVNIQTA